MSPPTLLQRHQIDDEAWNALIDRSLYSVIYAYTWYLDCVSPDWQALVWPSPENYEVVMPLPVRRKFGLTVVQQPLFCQYLGLFSENEISENQATDFLVALSRHFSYISVYDFHPGLTPNLGKILSLSTAFTFQEKTTHWLDLGQPYSKLTENYKKDRRKNLNKSEENDWEVAESQEIEPLISLFQQNHASQIQSVKKSTYGLLRNLTQVLRQKKMGRIQYARLNGKIHAGTMILENDGMGIYIFNAADETGRKGNARTFLLDKYFQENAERLKIFDFESPEVESIARFYESFGAERQPFISIKKNKLPFPLRQLRELRKWFLFRHRADT